LDEKKLIVDKIVFW